MVVCWFWGSSQHTFEDSWKTDVCQISMELALPLQFGTINSQIQHTFEESWQMTNVSPRVGFLQINIPSRNFDKWQTWINIPSKNRDKWQTFVLSQGSPDQHTFEESWQIDSTYSQNHKSIARPGPICMSSLWLVGLVIGQRSVRSQKSRPRRAEICKISKQGGLELKKQIVFVWTKILLVRPVMA